MTNRGRSPPFPFPFAYVCPLYSRLPACYDFLWGFSWSALIKIEGELFYPFLRRCVEEIRPTGLTLPTPWN